MIVKNFSFEKMAGKILYCEKYNPPNPITETFRPRELKYFAEDSRWVHKYIQDLNSKIPQKVWADRVGWLPEMPVHVLDNAWGHGNKKDPSKSIHVSLYLGYLGMIYEIEDSGNGFDIDKTINGPHNPEFKDNKNYGFKRMKSSKATVAYNEKGNICRIMYLKKDYCNPNSFLNIKQSLTQFLSGEISDLPDKSYEDRIEEVFHVPIS